MCSRKIIQDPSSNVMDYWGDLGLLDTVARSLPKEFHIIFEIARTILSEQGTDSNKALEDLLNDNFSEVPDREMNIEINRLDKDAPIGERMELDMFRNINDLKRALPRELAHDDEIFDAKLRTRTLMVRRFYESEKDSIKPISTCKDNPGRDVNRFEQKCYVLMDRSRSMDSHMRIFYAKCLVAEFLRKKRDSNARLFYRPFDTYPGQLFKIETKSDFHDLIERVLYTVSGGSSTNLQSAISQAVKDINFEKDMLNTEILVVTDGVCAIDVEEMRSELKDIRLNVLKIGKDIPVPDYFTMEKLFKRCNLPFNPQSPLLWNIQESLNEYNDPVKRESFSLEKKGILRGVQSNSDAMYKDLRDISYRFIEIDDLPKNLGISVDEESVQQVLSLVERCENDEPLMKIFSEREEFFKRINFLAQYIDLLFAMGYENIRPLETARDRLESMKKKMLKEPELLVQLVESGFFDNDKELLKLAKKEAKQLLKDAKLQNLSLPLKELRNAQIMSGAGFGKGSIFKMLYIMFYRIWMFIRGALLKLAGKKK